MTRQITLVFLLLAMISMVSALPSINIRATSLLANGQSCDMSTQCQSQYCRRGACDDKKEDGHVCYKDAGCLSGKCDGSTCQPNSATLSSSSIPTTPSSTSSSSSTRTSTSTSSSSTSTRTSTSTTSTSTSSSTSSRSSSTTSSTATSTSTTSSSTSSRSSSTTPSTATSTTASSTSSKSTTTTTTTTPTSTRTTTAQTTTTTAPTTTATTTPTSTRTTSSTTRTSSTSQPTVTKGTYNPGRFYYEGAYVLPTYGTNPQNLSVSVSDFLIERSATDVGLYDMRNVTQIWILTSQGYMQAPSGRVLATDGKAISLISKDAAASSSAATQAYHCEFTEDHVNVLNNPGSRIQCSAATALGTSSSFYVCFSGQIQADLAACPLKDNPRGQKRIDQLYILRPTDRRRKRWSWAKWA